MSIYRNISFEPAPSFESGTGRSGLIQNFLSVSVGNLELSSLHQLFSSPTKEALTLISSLHQLFSSPTKEALTLISIHEISIS